MFLFCLFVLVFSGARSEEGDLGYNLNIGYAIDLFANYGDLGQVTRVVSSDYEDRDDGNDGPAEPFNEKNIRIFANATSSETISNVIDDNMSLLFCDTFEELLEYYFKDFSIEGLSQPWKAFMGDWIPEEIMRTLGIEYNPASENCCFVLAKLSKSHRTVKMNNLTGQVAVKEYVKRAINDLDYNDDAKMRRFMENYGTHYINSYVTGNFIYQVFKYKRVGYNLLKAYMRKGRSKTQPDNLRFYFSSYFLQNVGDIRIASGNKTIEAWARHNLRDSQYLYSRPSLMRLYYNHVLVYKLNQLLDNGALLAMNLKTLKPIFQDRRKGDKFEEIIENDLLLWEVNA
ncbi:torso-like protein [Plutella xylostella]|uniref:torso-like protein n=1 Tax=Plutella xylostella TaxID=51655 RepID=UPI0020328BDB|nr:torso-like protein [Plutella xylostella]